MRVIVACALATAAALVTAPQAFASSLSVTAPSTAQQGGDIPVHVTGTADEFELSWAAFVQNEACPATFAEARSQPDAVRQDNTQFSQKGPFEFDSTLSSVVGQEPPGKVLTGTVNVCSYLYHEFTTDQSTVASDVDAVTLIAPQASPFQFFGRMSKQGTIRVATTCTAGCLATVTYTSTVSGKTNTVTKHLGASNSPASIQLQLDKKTVALVKKIRRKRHGGPVKVKVHATAKPPSGPTATATHTVKVT
jgi:hypothetical protein